MDGEEPEGMLYLISLGSNLGDPRKNLARAVGLLARSGLEVRAVSSVYRTEPVDLLDQPWFCNQAASVETWLEPERLLDVLQAIESGMGRVRNIPKGPRVIDLDILLAGGFVISSPRLTIPHPGLTMRRFVLVPLAELAPDSVDPLSGKTVSELLRDTPDRSGVFRLDGGRDR